MSSKLANASEMMFVLTQKYEPFFFIKEERYKGESLGVLRHTRAPQKECKPPIPPISNRNNVALTPRDNRGDRVLLLRRVEENEVFLRERKKQRGKKRYKKY